jgi:isoquinoline 1-oxidoreductase beta subunit
MAVAGVERVLDLGTGVAVVATNTWSAIQGAEALEAVWGPAPYPADTAAQMEAIDAAFLTRKNSRLRDDGDIEAALAGDGVIEAEYRVPFLAHAAMEPMTATAWVKPDGTMEIWSGNQGPLVTRDKAAEAAGIDAEKVTVHTTLMGGAFGRRGETDFSVLAARVAARLKGTPVQVTWSREEDMRHDFYRPAAIARFEGRVSGGRAVALKARIAAPSVARQAAARLFGFAPPGPDKGMVEGLFDQPYAIPNYRVDGHIADLDVPIGFWRSVGASHNGFFTESFIDEMAHAAGADPLGFRLDLIRPLHEPSARLLEAVREISGWTGKTPEGIGRGVAFVHSFGTPVAEVVEVRQTEAGIRIAEAWVACDPGVALDPRNIEAQMISGLIFGLSAAVSGEITFAGGEVEQGNFPDMDPLRMHTAPKVTVHVQELNGHISGVGEPGTPPAAAALANALFDLTGKRARALPLNRRFDFVS